MKRIGINGVEYPLCMTVNVAETFEKRYGALQKVVSAYTGKSPVAAFKETLWQLALLIEGGCDYAALTSNETIEPISEKELGILCPISRLGEFQAACLEALKDGLSREVETESERKNGKTTQSKKR